MNDVFHKVLVAMGPYWPLVLTLIVYPILTAILNWYLWWDTAAHWDAFQAKHPNLALVVRVMRAIGPHFRKLVVAWRDFTAAKSGIVVTQDEVPPAPPKP